MNFCIKLWWEIDYLRWRIVQRFKSIDIQLYNLGFHKEKELNHRITYSRFIEEINGHQKVDIENCIGFVSFTCSEEYRVPLKLTEQKPTVLTDRELKLFLKKIKHKWKRHYKILFDYDWED